MLAGEAMGGSGFDDEPPHDGRLREASGEGLKTVSDRRHRMKIERLDQGVSLLRMDDGKVNAMGPSFVTAFEAAWREAEATGDAIVVAGNAKAFSAGLDLKTLPTLDRAALETFARGFMGIFRDVLAHPRPVVAAVDGPALAGGAVLALASDFRLVAPRARIGLTEVPVGVPFPTPVADLARDRLPPQEHAPALLRGLARTGAEAVATGWAHALVEPEALLPEAAKLAAEVGAHSTLAVASAKGGSAALAARFDAFVKNEASRWAGLVSDPATKAAIAEGFARAAKRQG